MFKTSSHLKTTDFKEEMAHCRVGSRTEFYFSSSGPVLESITAPMGSMINCLLPTPSSLCFPTLVRVRIWLWEAFISGFGTKKSYELLKRPALDLKCFPTSTILQLCSPNSLVQYVVGYFLEVPRLWLLLWLFQDTPDSIHVESLG